FVVCTIFHSRCSFSSLTPRSLILSATITFIVSLFSVRRTPAALSAAPIFYDKGRVGFRVTSTSGAGLDSVKTTHLSRSHAYRIANQKTRQGGNPRIA